MKKQEISEILKQTIYVDTELEQPAPVITIQGKTIATPGNVVTINGLPKSRKTTYQSFFIASALSGSVIFDIKVNLQADEKIILIDTEQSIYDFSRQIRTLKKIIKSQNLPGNFSAYLFRQFEPDIILNSIYELVKTERPKILFIDNLTELVVDFNNVQESKKVIQFLKKITAEFNLVVICLLHLGKGNLQTLGNLGSMADRMAQSTLKIVLDKDTGASTMEAGFLRSDSHFNPVAVYWNEEQKQYEQTTDISTKPKNSRKFILMELKDQDHFNRLAVIFKDNREVIYSELVEEVKKIYGVGTNIAKQQIIPYLAGNNFITGTKGIYKINLNK